MITIIEKIKNKQQTEHILNKAADILTSGGLVAFPTETVYGLGANALDENAARKIYAAKGRPSDNPLIVHIANVTALKDIAAFVPESAKRLIHYFWPGPLTLIFQKSEKIPYSVTGGLNTVAVRYPHNEIATMLIRKCGFPIAAPSANSSGKPSPTRASHVIYDLSGKIDLIIDGGPCTLGLESTILDVSGDTPQLLRPGAITRESIEKILNTSLTDLSITNDRQKPKAPGMKYTHYAPAATVTIVNGNPLSVIEKINTLVKEAVKNGQHVGVLATEESAPHYICDTVIVVGRRTNPEEIARNLFKTLRKFDRYGMDIVYAEAFSQFGVGEAIMNRLIKAAGKRIIDV